MSENIVAICDVDTKHAAEAFKMFSESKKYSDYRKMLDSDTIKMIGLPQRSYLDK